MEVHSEMNTRQCMYHSKKWRNKFQCIMNKLGRKIIPRKYLYQIWKFVCICGNSSALPDEYFSEHKCTSMSSLRTFFQSEFSKSYAQLNDIESLVLECSYTERDHSFQSRWRFLLVLKHCMECDFALLNYENGYQPSYVRSLISNCKYHHKTTLQVSFPSEYIIFILGSKGRHIQRICTHYDCEIRFELSRYGASRPVHRRYMTSNLFGKVVEAPCRKVNVHVLYNKTETLADVRDALMHHIARVVARRQKHKLQVEKYTEQGQKILQQKIEKRRKQYEFELKHGYTKGPGNAWGAAVNRKINAFEFHNVKVHHRMKDQKKRRKPVLQGGFCKNCLQPVRRGTFREGACQYHPGYLVSETDHQQMVESLEQVTLSDSSEESQNGDSDGVIFEELTESRDKPRYMWSCCGQVHNEPNSRTVEKESHESGCTKEMHDYQPPKKPKPLGRKRHASKKKFDSEDL